SAFNSILESPRFLVFFFDAESHSFEKLDLDLVQLTGTFERRTTSKEHTSAMAFTECSAANSGNSKGCVGRVWKVPIRDSFDDHASGINGAGTAKIGETVAPGPCRVTECPR